MIQDFDRVLRVVARFQMRASNPVDSRSDARDNTTVVNPPRGFSEESKKEYVQSEETSDSVKPERRDIRPEDVFRPTPKNMSVQNYVRQGWPGESGDYEGMGKAIRNQIPKDKGYDTVKNLSQYLLETQGGGGTPPVEK